MRSLWTRSCHYVRIFQLLTITWDSVCIARIGENNYKMQIENPKIREMCLSSWWCIRLEEVAGALLVRSMEETSNLTLIFYPNSQ